MRRLFVLVLAMGSFSIFGIQGVASATSPSTGLQALHACSGEKSITCFSSLDMHLTTLFTKENREEAVREANRLKGKFQIAAKRKKRPCLKFKKGSKRRKRCIREVRKKRKGRKVKVRKSKKRSYSSSKKRPRSGHEKFLNMFCKGNLSTKERKRCYAKWAEAARTHQGKMASKEMRRRFVQKCRAMKKDRSVNGRKRFKKSGCKK